MKGTLWKEYPIKCAKQKHLFRSNRQIPVEVSTQHSCDPKAPFLSCLASMVCRQPSPEKRQPSELQSRNRTRLKCELSLIRASQQPRDTAQTQGGGRAAFASTMKVAPHEQPTPFICFYFLFYKNFTQNSFCHDIFLSSLYCWFCGDILRQRLWPLNHDLGFPEPLLCARHPAGMTGWRWGKHRAPAPWELVTLTVTLAETVGASKRDTKPSGQLDGWSVRCPSLKNPQMGGMSASIKGV